MTLNSFGEEIGHRTETESRLHSKPGRRKIAGE